MESCLQEVRSALSYQVCWCEFPVSEIPFANTPSQDLRQLLQDCDRAVVFAATVGIGLDRLIARYSRVSPARALLFQAIGAERIEALCDLFCGEIAREQAALGRRTTMRFSPGYGDLPLELQRSIFPLLDCSRKIGLTLNESLLMSPSKSVTAIFGIGAHADACTVRSGCAACKNKDCLYRRSV